MRSTRNLLLVVVLGGMSIAVPVLAEPAADYPPACEASKVTRSDVERAHTVYLSGKQFLEEANYDKAISYFKDAYSIDCSVHAILPIIATAYERKGDKAEAVRALEEYVRRAPSAPDHEVLARRIKNLKDQLARDQSAATGSATASATAATPSPPQPPVATAPAEAPISIPTALPQTAAAPSPRANGHTALPWVVVGVGGAALLTGVVFYAVGANDLSIAQKNCVQHDGGKYTCPTQADKDQGTQGVAFENVGGWVGAGGLVLVAAGLMWHFLEGSESSTSTAVPSAARITPAVAPGYLGIALESAF